MLRSLFRRPAFPEFFPLIKEAPRTAANVDFRDVQASLVLDPQLDGVSPNHVMAATPFSVERFTSEMRGEVSLYAAGPHASFDDLSPWESAVEPEDRALRPDIPQDADTEHTVFNREDLDAFKLGTTAQLQAANDSGHCFASGVVQVEQAASSGPMRSHVKVAFPADVLPFRLNFERKVHGDGRIEMIATDADKPGRRFACEELPGDRVQILLDPETGIGVRYGLKSGDYSVTNVRAAGWEHVQQLETTVRGADGTTVYSVGAPYRKQGETGLGDVTVEVARDGTVSVPDDESQVAAKNGLKTKKIKVEMQAAVSPEGVIFVKPRSRADKDHNDLRVAMAIYPHKLYKEKLLMPMEGHFNVGQARGVVGVEGWKRDSATTYDSPYGCVTGPVSWLDVLEGPEDQPAVKDGDVIRYGVTSYSQRDQTRRYGHPSDRDTKVACRVQSGASFTNGYLLQGMRAGGSRQFIEHRPWGTTVRTIEVLEVMDEETALANAPDYSRASPIRYGKTPQ